VAAAGDFRDGRFAHDDISQIAAAGSTLFTVWRSNRVSVHGVNGTLDLSAGVQNHVFAEPVHLISIARAQPLVNRTDADLPPGMYVTEGPRVWRFVDRGWMLLRDRDEIETVQSYEQNRPIYQRKRWRLVRTAGGSLTFQMRMPGAQWESVPWDSSADRLSIDVWTNIRIAGSILWVATPHGMVTYDRSGRFDPDLFRFVAAVPAESGREITEWAIENNRARVRYAADSGKVYDVELDETANPVRYARVGTDPFAQQTFATASYWAWSLTDRVGPKMGRLVGRWKGEPIQFANGRFDLDGFNSMASFNGRLHFATAGRGWFESPMQSTALADVSRPALRGPDPLDVSRLHSDGDTKAPHLCLEQRGGEFIRLAADGSSEKTRGCATLLGRDRFWRYAIDGTTISGVPDGRTIRPGARRLSDGRFTDDVIVGPLVAVPGSRHVLVPTLAGIMRFSDVPMPIDMVAPPFGAQATTPAALHVRPKDEVLYVAGDGFHDMTGTRIRPDPWTLKLPKGIEPERIESGPERLIRVEWTQSGERHHDVIDPDRPVAQSRDVLAFDARNLRAHRRRIDPRQDGWLRVIMQPESSPVVPSTMPTARIAVPASFGPLEGIAWKGLGVVVGRRDLMELNLERVSQRVTPPGATSTR
jgi:hypothetical protein